MQKVDSSVRAESDCSRKQKHELLVRGRALEKRRDVHLNAEGKSVECTVHTSAVARVQIEQARCGVVKPEVDPVITGQGHTAFRWA